MNPSTNVHDLPIRRRDDTGNTHRSTPAFAVPVPLPLAFDNDEQFADALLAQEREQRRHRAKVELARREERRLAEEQLRKNQINEAHRTGHNLGLDKGFTRGWYWGLAFGLLIGGSVIGLIVKAGAMLASHT